MVLRTCLIEELRSFGEELDREVDIADNLRRGPSNPIFRQRPGFGTTALIHHEGRASQRCPRWWIHPGRPVTRSPPAMVGPTNDTQIYGRYFFRHRAVTTHRAHNSKAARALRRAAFKMNCQTAPVPFIL